MMDLSRTNGVRLPVRIPSPLDAQSAEALPGAPSERRILVADDNRDAATSLCMMLRLLGYKTRAASDGLEALQAAAEFRPDVILLDLGMPKLNGYDVARQLRGESWAQDVVLIAVTGWGQAEDRQRTFEAGFEHHMVKPVDPAALARLLASLSGPGRDQAMDSNHSQ